MADQFNLDSKSYKRLSTQALPTPVETVFPSGDDRYLGAHTSSDAATIAGPLASPKAAWPGAAGPGQPWRSIDPTPRKRGALRR